VKRGLVESPEFWPWSSYRAYFLGETGPVRINEWGVLKMKMRSPAALESLGIDGWAGHFSKARSGAPPAGLVLRLIRSSYTSREKLATRLFSPFVRRHASHLYVHIYKYTVSWDTLYIHSTVQTTRAPTRLFQTKTKRQNQSKSNVKGSGQECPLYTVHGGECLDAPLQDDRLADSRNPLLP
jgi:hypothetical protein